MSDQMFQPLWQAAHGIISQVWRWFGGPSQIAKAKFYDQRDHNLLMRFLRGAEAMVRAALLVRAVELCLAGDAPLPQPARTSRLRHTRGAQAKSVSFRVFDLTPSRHNRRRSTATPPLYPPMRYFSAEPIARRAEALLRVFKAPETHARRLARKLKAKPHLARRINAEYQSHYQIIPTELWMKTCDTVRGAVRWLCDSS